MKTEFNLNNPTLQVADDNSLLVQGIENWITSLLPMPHLNVTEGVQITGAYLVMKDPQTGALFEVRRIV